MVRQLVQSVILIATISFAAACTFDAAGIAANDAAGATDAPRPRDGGAAVDGGEGTDGGGQGTLMMGDVRLSYGSLGVFQLSSERWRSADNRWESGPTGDFLTGSMLWTAGAVGGGAQSVELVAALGTLPAGGDRLYMFRLDGADWSADWTRDIPSSDKRGVDVAFESSGDAMVVYADGTDIPKYRVRVGDTWGTDLPVPGPVAGGCPSRPGCVVQWIELVSLPGSDKLAVAYADTERNLTVSVWDGDQWQTNATVLETNLKANRVSNEVHNRVFDLAFEELSGELMVMWGRHGSGVVWFSRYPWDIVPSLWSPVVAVDMVAGETHFVDLSTRPGTNWIAAAVYDLGEGTERLGAATWNGAQWVDVGELDSQIRNVDDGARSDWPGEVAWVGDTGRAVLIYADNKPGELQWASWSEGVGWALETPVLISGKQLSESMHLVRSAAGVLVAAFSDESGGLYAASYDGLGWTVALGGSAITSGVASLDTVPFSLAASPR